ncbi:MAG: IPT/TIG domain-containing protein, partial [Pyrinomonadaceae bacterium]
AIGLNYVNGDAVNDLCGPQLDLNCYGNFRLEVLDGTDRSSLVNVNRPNSIENRLIKLLIYMQQINPAANWGQFLDAQNGIRWDKIVVAGHSQGGGHAGIIGKVKRVARVIMFAAMDFSGALNSVANWISVAGVTPNGDFYGFSHQQDEEVNYTVLSTRAWTAYGMNAFGAPVNVDVIAPAYNNTHSLNSNFPTIPSGSNYHGCIVVDTRFPVDPGGVSIYAPVWRYLLNTNAALAMFSLQFVRLGQPVSRPLVGTTTKGVQLSVNGSGFEATSQIVINGANAETEFVSTTELEAKLPAGRVGSIGSSTVQVRNLSGAVSNLVSY